MLFFVVVVFLCLLVLSFSASPFYLVLASHYFFSFIMRSFIILALVAFSLPLYLAINLFVCLSIQSLHRLLIYLSIYLLYSSECWVSISLSIYFSIHPSVCLSMNLSVYLFISLSIHLLIMKWWVQFYFLIQYFFLHTFHFNLSLFYSFYFLKAAQRDISDILHVSCLHAYLRVFVKRERETWKRIKNKDHAKVT